MKHKNLLHFTYKFPITKKIEGDTVYLIDEQTGVLFSFSQRGIVTFQNIEGSKWVYTEVTLYLEKDLLHFTRITEDGSHIIDGLFMVTEDKNSLFRRAYNYFSAFIVENQPFTDTESGKIFLN